VAPTEMEAVAGVTAMEARVFGAADTVRAALPLMPSMVAVTVVEPAPSAVAIPALVMLATFAFVSVQVADAVTSAVEPSLKVALALNCRVAPTERSSVAGDAAMVISVLPEPPEPEEDVPPHPAMASRSGKVSEKKRVFISL
jgi:hypothetical protein